MRDLVKRLLFSLLLAMTPLAAHAQFTTTSDGNGGVIVTGFSPNTVTTLTIPSTISAQAVTGIGSQAFANFVQLTSVAIPTSVTSIGSDAFQNCTALGSVTIPTSVTAIGSEAFLNCVLMTSVTISGGVTSIGDNAFNNCASLGSIALPNSVTSLGQSVFNGCANLTSVTIGTGVTSLGYQTFFGCNNLTSVTIPLSVTSIGQQAFDSCTNLATVSIGSGVTSIGDEAFFDCESLANVTIPSSVTSIGVGPFAFCVSLTAINVNSLSSTFSSSVDGVLFDKAKATLIQFPAGKSGSYAVPATVTALSDEAFYGNASVTSVTIPSGVTSLGTRLFYSCTALTNVTIPASVTTINPYALASCTALTGVTIPAGVTTIGEFAFSHCESLTSVTIPNSVTTMGQYVFSSCASLQSVTIGSGVTTLGQYAFYNCADLTSALFTGNAPTVGQNLFQYAANGFVVSYYKAATGFSTPTWTDSAGDSYASTSLLTPQTITFPAISTQPYPSSFNLNATASSGLAVTFQYVSGPASLSNGTLTLNGPGTVVIQATQAGNSTYAAAASVNQSFAVQAGQTLGAWSTAYSITDLTAIPFGDGVPYLLKYFYHIDPTTTLTAQDRTALPKVGMDTTTTAGTTYLTLTYRQYVVATGLTVRVQSSLDLLTWTTVTPDITAQTGTDATTNDPIITVEVKVTGPRQFIRLDATAP